jgi:hypothetical protein
LAHHVPVFGNPAGSFRPGAVYDPFLQRYLLSMTDNYDAAQNYLGIFDAPNPWGPWTTVTYQDGWGGDPEHRFAPQIPSKWLSQDGRHFYLEYSALGGPYQFNLQEVSLRLVPVPAVQGAAPSAGLEAGGGFLSTVPAWVFPGATGLAGDGRGTADGSPHASAGARASFGGDTGGFRPNVRVVVGAPSPSFHAQRANQPAEAQAFDIASQGDDAWTGCAAGQLQRAGSAGPCAAG